MWPWKKSPVKPVENNTRSSVLQESDAVRAYCLNENCGNVLSIVCEDQAQVIHCNKCKDCFSFFNSASLTCTCGKEVRISVNAKSSTSTCVDCRKTFAFERGTTDQVEPLKVWTLNELQGVMRCALSHFAESPEEAYVGKAFFDTLGEIDVKSKSRPNVLIRPVKIPVETLPVSHVFFLHAYMSNSKSPHGYNYKMSGDAAWFLNRNNLREMVREYKLQKIWISGTQVWEHFQGATAVAKLRNRMEKVPNHWEEELNIVARDVREMLTEN